MSNVISDNEFCWSVNFKSNKEQDRAADVKL